MHAQFGTTNELSDQIESIQKRVLKIICGSSIINYEQLRILYNLPSLSETLCKQFFKYLC